MDDDIRDPDKSNREPYLLSKLSSGLHLLFLQLYTAFVTQTKEVLA